MQQLVTASKVLGGMETKRGEEPSFSGHPFYPIQVFSLPLIHASFEDLFGATAACHAMVRVQQSGQLIKSVLSTGPIGTSGFGSDWAFSRFPALDYLA